MPKSVNSRAGRCPSTEVLPKMSHLELDLMDLHMTPKVIINCVSNISSIAQMQTLIFFEDDGVSNVA